MAKLRDAEVMLNSGKDLAAVLQTLEVCEATYHRWRNQFGGMKSEKAQGAGHRECSPEASVGRGGA